MGEEEINCLITMKGAGQGKGRGWKWRGLRVGERGGRVVEETPGPSTYVTL